MNYLLFYALCISLLSIPSAFGEQPQTTNEKTNEKPYKTELEPYVGINRVDGIYPKMTGKLFHDNGFSGSLTVGKTFESKRYLYGIELGQKWGASKKWFSTVSYNDGTVPRIKSKVFSETINSIMYFFGRDEYFDYFRNRRYKGEIGRYLFSNKASISVAVHYEKHESLPKLIDNEFFNKNHIQPINRSAYNGHYGSMSFSILWNDISSPTQSQLVRNAEFTFEQAEPSLFSSDHSFKRAVFILDGDIDTFFRNATIPNRLKYRIDTSWGTEDLPIQYYSAIDGRFSGLSPFGAVKTLDKGQVGGNSHIALFAEHTFRSVPFDILRLKKLTGSMEFSVNGAYGKTWAPSTSPIRCANYYTGRINSGHGEIGISFQNVFRYFRLHLSKHLDSSDYFFNWGFAKLY